MRSLTKFVFVCVLALGLAPAASAEDAPCEISNFEYSRQRMTPRGANLVTATFTLTNLARATLTDVSVSIRYENAMGKKQIEIGPERVNTLKGNKSIDLMLEDVHVPIFNNYIITVEGKQGGKKQSWEFFGFPNMQVPLYLPKTPHPNVCNAIRLGSEVERGRRNSALLKVRVRNLGGFKVSNLTAKIQLINDAGRGVGKVITKKMVGAKGKRDGELEGGEERVFKLYFKRFPEYKNYSVTLDWSKPTVVDLFSGGEFAGAKDIEFAHLSFKKSGKRWTISGKVRNGYDFDVIDVRVHIKLLEQTKKGYRVIKKEIGKIKSLAAGKTAPLTVVFSGVEKFDNFEYESEFNQAMGSTGGGADANGQLQLAITDMVRDGKTVSLTALFTNGLEFGVKDVEVTINFLAGGKQVSVQTLAYPAVIPALAKRSCTLDFENMPEFDEYTVALKYNKAGE